MDKAIIVADDSMIIKNIIEKALSDEYVVLKASNGKEAINHIVAKKYELYILILFIKNKKVYFIQVNLCF